MNLKINESQNIEFKQTWRDEYIKWLSAFQVQKSELLERRCRKHLNTNAGFI